MPAIFGLLDSTASVVCHLLDPCRVICEAAIDGTGKVWVREDSRHRAHLRTALRDATLIFGVVGDWWVKLKDE